VRGRRAALWGLGLLLLLSGACARRQLEVVPLDDDVIAAYLEAYRVIAPVYRQAYEAGGSPSAIPGRDEIRDALGQAGWSWEQYQNVHGSVSNALLYIEDPETFRRMELRPGDAPPRNVRVVKAHYFEIKKARLIGQEETYKGRKPASGGPGS